MQQGHRYREWGMDLLCTCVSGGERIERGRAAVLPTSRRPTAAVSFGDLAPFAVAVAPQHRALPSTALALLLHVWRYIFDFRTVSRLYSCVYGARQVWALCVHTVTQLLAAARRGKESLAKRWLNRRELIRPTAPCLRQLHPSGAMQ